RQGVREIEDGGGQIRESNRIHDVDLLLYRSVQRRRTKRLFCCGRAAASKSKRCLRDEENPGASVFVPPRILLSSMLFALHLPNTRGAILRLGCIDHIKCWPLSSSFSLAISYCHYVSRRL